MLMLNKMSKQYEKRLCYCDPVSCETGGGHVDACVRPANSAAATLTCTYTTLFTALQQSSAFIVLSLACPTTLLYLVKRIHIKLLLMQLFCTAQHYHLLYI